MLTASRHLKLEAAYLPWHANPGPIIKAGLMYVIRHMHWDDVLVLRQTINVSSSLKHGLNDVDDSKVERMSGWVTVLQLGLISPVKHAKTQDDHRTIQWESDQSDDWKA